MAGATCGFRHLQPVVLLLLWSTGYVMSEICDQAGSVGCLTPDRRAGRCVHIDSCESLRKALEITPRSEKTKDYLRKAECGVELVCCQLYEYVGFPNTKDGLNPGPEGEGEEPVTEETGNGIDPTPTPSVDVDMSTENTNQGDRWIRTGPGVVNHSNWKYLSTEVCGASITDQIFGGEEADLKGYPWLALLQYKHPTRLLYECDGALISPRYVLTAAHCIRTMGYGKLWRVHLGEHDTKMKIDCTKDFEGTYCGDPVEEFHVESTTVHPMYSLFSREKHHDIGLIRLDRNAAFTDFISPICLPNGKAIAQRHENTNMTVAGWGFTEKGYKSNVKLWVNLPVITNAQCESIYPKRIIDNQLCAGGVKGKDSCGGDSGGPLMTVDAVVPGRKGNQWMVAGIVSLGQTNCGTEGKPAIYTRVAPYMNWILDNLKP